MHTQLLYRAVHVGADSWRNRKHTNEITKQHSVYSDFNQPPINIAAARLTTEK